jgi:hypothetical protein
MLIVSDALIEGNKALTLHPALLPWHKKLEFCRRQWFSCKDKIPLEWYAAIVDVSPAVLLATQCSNIPVDTKQCWVASPYHSQLGRDQVRVIPEGLFPWCAEDAIWLCDVLNPLLGEEGMHLLRVGAALLLTCCDPMDAQPMSFARISGKTLPNRHPEGSDGGRLMRLVSEIQMILHNNQPSHRSGQPEIHGLWIWGGNAWPAAAPESMPTVATRNPFLQAVADGKDANMTITEADRLPDLLKPEAPLPVHLLLAGEDYVVHLTKSYFNLFRHKTWDPSSVKDKKKLFTVLCRL